MKIGELNGRRFKRDLGLTQCLKSWSNKHVDKSGNCGYVMKTPKWYLLAIDYDGEGEIWNLRFMDYGYGGKFYFDVDGKEARSWSYAKLIRELRKALRIKPKGSKEEIERLREELLFS